MKRKKTKARARKGVPGRLRKAVPFVPPHYHPVMPGLAVRGAAEAIAFYKKAFGAVQRGEVFPMPDGKVGHAELKIAGSTVMLSDEFPDWGSFSPASLNGTTVTVWLYVKDVDALFNQAVAAGAKPVMPVSDQFWGDRMGQVTDPFGHRWSIATHKEDLSPREIKARGAAFFAKAGAGN